METARRLGFPPLFCWCVSVGLEPSAAAIEDTYDHVRMLSPSLAARARRDPSRLLPLPGWNPSGSPCSLTSGPTRTNGASSSRPVPPPRSRWWERCFPGSAAVCSSTLETATTRCLGSESTPGRTGRRCGVSMSTTLAVTLQPRSSSLNPTSSVSDEIRQTDIQQTVEGFQGGEDGTGIG